jgi:NADPH-dependent 2,4-dienoyl-CoA reductase/sulfur reductase-like enzyme
LSSPSVFDKSLTQRVVIIGDGAAGLEMARVAALQGYQISLYGKESELGGQLNIAAKARGRADFAEVTRYYAFQMKLLNVEVHLGTGVTAEMTIEKNPDAAVVATGSLPEKPFLPGSDVENVAEVREVL